MPPLLPALPPNTLTRFNPDDGYKRWLFRMAKGLQSSELNEIQQSSANEMKTFLDAEFGDGAMLSGGLISSQATTGKVVTWRCDAGTFYAQGFTHVIPASTFTVALPGSATFPAGETCAVGIIVHVDVVDETMDISLLDQAPGTKNFGEPGAARMRYKARFGKATEVAGANDFFYSRLDFTAGVPSGGNNVDQNIAGLAALVAEYDRNSNGNYVVSGNIVAYVGDDPNTSSHILQISNGQSNVSGYEQKLSYATNVEVLQALDVKQVLAEPATFTVAGVYPLRHAPIAAVGPQVNGIVEVTQSVIHGAYIGATDPLPNTPVVSISLIVQGATTYVPGTDYVQSGDKVSWINSGHQPSPGSTYTITYRYSSVFTPSITADRLGINVSGLAANTVFYIDYTYFVPRYDLVVIGQGLKITTIKGVPSDNPVPPSSTSGLVLGTVYISYGSAPTITNTDQRRPLTSDLVTMRHTLDDIKYNIARLSLQDRLTSQDPVTLMKGVFVDPFIDGTYRDAGVAQTAAIAAGVLYMAVPWSYTVLTPTNVNTPKTILGYSTTVQAQQLMHSEIFQVNQFGGVAPPPAQTTTWPVTYVWVDSVISSQVLTAPAYIPYWAIGGVPAGIPWAGPPGDPRNQLAGTAVVATTFNQSMILSPVPVPQVTISYSSQRYNAYEGVQIWFDNRLIGTANADANGNLSGSFQTPSGTLSGSKVINFVGTVSGVQGTSSFTAVPFADSTTRVVQQTVYYDPLAETFGPSVDDVFITDAVAWITRNGQSAPNGFIDVMLLETSVGFPDRAQTLGVTRLYDNQITDAANGNRPTQFVFPQPIRIDGSKQYAIVLASNSPVYYAWGCTLGDYDMTYGRWISAKPTTGTLLESSNSATWLPRLKDDLTYVVNRAVFQSSRTVTYPTANVTAVTDLLLLANVNTPSGTSVVWSASLTVAGKTVTYPITPNAPLTIPLYSGPVVITANLTTTNSKLTPSIDPVVTLATGQVVNPSTYVTRSIPVPANASAAVSTMKVYLEIGEIDPNTVLTEYLAADGVTWVPFTRDVMHATQQGFGIVDMPLITSATSMVGASQTRVRITLSSVDPNRVRRSFAKNLRMYFD